MSAPLAVSRLFTGLKIAPCSVNCAFRLKPCKRTVSSDAASESAQDVTVTDPSVGNASRRKAERISQAMRAYLERAKQFDDFMKAEVAEYEIGKRHLANIMGVDAESFTQKDIDMAITYLLPSGLTDKKAHPQMKHPVEVIPQVKAAQFGMDGRPFHHMFYTCKPSYYQLLHEAAVKYDNLKAIEDRHFHVPSTLNKKLILAGSQWVNKNVVETKLKEKLQDAQYEHLTKSLERLASHPYSMREKEFIMQFRHELQTQVILDEVPPLHQDEAGRSYMDGEGSRKKAKASVRVYENGTGEVIINGKAMLDYFPHITCREQIMTPLQLTGKLNKVDIHATITDGGPSGQAGAVRLAVSRALQSFVEPDMVEQMRLAGLLTRDPRVRERKKPGQEGARRKFTWKKR